MAEDVTAEDVEVGCVRHSQLKLGSYSTAAFRARLQMSHAPIEGAADGSFAIFTHEYWHHLHNVTTLTGAERFRAIQILLCLFSKTIDKDTHEAIGSQTRLSPEEIQLFHEQQEALKQIEGELGPEGRTERNGLEARVVGISGPRITVEIIKQGIVVETQQFVLGARAIEESLAFLVERMVGEDQGSICAQAAEFPYWVVIRLAEFLSGLRPGPLRAWNAVSSLEQPGC